MIWNLSYFAKVSRRIIYLLCICIGLYFAFKLSIFYMPFLIAFIISILMEPIIRYLMKKVKLTRKFSAILILTIAFAIIIGLLVWGIFSLVSEASNLLHTLNNYFDKAYIQIQELINYFNVRDIKVPEEILGIINQSSKNLLLKVSLWVSDFLKGILDMFTSLPSTAIYFVITIMSLYFISTDKIYILDFLEHHLPRLWMKKISSHVREIVKALGGYLKAQATLIMISFIISIIGLYIYKFVGLNVEYPLLAALAIGFVDALPILGSGTVMVPWGIISAMNGDIKLGIAIIILWIIMSIVRQLIEPKIVSTKIGIHPIFTLIAMYTGFKFIGFLGMFVGPIILIIIKNIFATAIDQGVMKMIFDKE